MSIKFMFMDAYHRIAIGVQLGSYRKAKMLPIVFSDKTSLRIKRFLRLFK
jgi:hypothetical protein